MLRLLTDENFIQDIVDGLRRVLAPSLMPIGQDIQEVGLAVQRLAPDEIRNQVIFLPLK